MPESGLLGYCPIWKVPCIKELCTSYEVHSKNRFWNLKSQQYIPIDQLSYYSHLTPEQLETTIERRITITHECRKLGKIIQIEEKTDHNIPFE